MIERHDVRNALLYYRYLVIDLATHEDASVSAVDHRNLPLRESEKSVYVLHFP